VPAWLITIANQVRFLTPQPREQAMQRCSSTTIGVMIRSVRARVFASEANLVKALLRKSREFRAERSAGTILRV
jgi:hypothetical protein